MMQAREILKSNFKHYRFVVYEKDVTTTSYDKDVKGGHMAFNIYKPKDLPNHYDIGYSYNCIMGRLTRPISANQVALFIDKTKWFKVDHLEYCSKDETLYIHCKEYKIH